MLGDDKAFTFLVDDAAENHFMQAVFYMKEGLSKLLRDFFRRQGLIKQI